MRKSTERDKQSAQQEAQLLKKLKHPNIVSYKESFQVDGYLHIVMLFCDGGDLYKKIKEHNDMNRYIDEPQIVEWFVQIAMALQVTQTVFFFKFYFKFKSYIKELFSNLSKSICMIITFYIVTSKLKIYFSLGIRSLKLEI